MLIQNPRAPHLSRGQMSPFERHFRVNEGFNFDKEIDAALLVTLTPMANLKFIGD